jgi:arylsulfatase A-like enzyme/tetratricopeptide (TPR) repeat protein
MRKKILIVAALLAFAVVFIYILRGKEKSLWKGNLLFITLDTTRSDILGCYGNSTIETPNIDRLAVGGVRFENCYSPVPLTLPSHCTIFTGKYPIGHGVRNNGTYYLNTDQTTLAEILKQEGYHTYAVIAAFVLLSKFGLDQGFDIYDDSLDSHKMINTFRTEIRADDVYKRFEDWFDKNKDKKFFSWVHFYDPHTPYTPPEDFFKKEDREDKFALYKGEVAFMDVYMGKIIDKLERAGLLEETLVVVVGDHGEAFGEHEEYADHSVFCYEENIRVPLIFHNPKLLKKPDVVYTRVDTSSIMPTLLELMDLPRPPSLQGSSLAPFFEGKRANHDKPIYIESIFGKEEMNWAPLTGIIDGDFKFISLPEPELYDLKNDRGEKKNLFKVKSDISRRMDKSLAELVMKHVSNSGNTRRKLSSQDVRRLESLGYVSAFSEKTKTMIDPKNGILFHNKLKELANQVEAGILDEPEIELKKIISETPEMVNQLVISQLYTIAVKRNRQDEALSILETGIEMFPELMTCRTLMAWMFYEKGQYEDVISLGKEMIALDPNTTVAHILIGYSYEKLNNPEETLKNYNKAIALEPENVTLMIKYAELLIKYGRFEEALTVYNNILENRDVQESPTLLYQIALFNTQHGSLAKAEDLLRRVVQLQAEGKYHYMYAVILSRNGKIDEALHHMETALERYSSQLTPDQRYNAEKAIQMWKNIR